MSINNVRVGVYDPLLSSSMNDKNCTALQLALALSSLGYAPYLLHEGKLRVEQVLAAAGTDIANLTLQEVTSSGEGMSGVSSYFPIFINTSTNRFVHNKSKAGYWFCPFPGTETLSRDMNTAVRSYTAIVANSHYSRRWFFQRWNCDTEVIFPWVPRIEKQYPTRDFIVAVGNFFAGQNNKRHGALITLFCEMFDAGLRGWEFHLLGNVGPDPKDRKYFSQLHALTTDYPVILHANPSPATLEKIVGRARIAWHATAYDADLNRHPDWIEAFNTEVASAMSAGCAPILFSAGSHDELVKEGLNGLLWRDWDELWSKTMKLTENPYSLGLLSRAAMETSQGLCSLERFAMQLQSMFDRTR